MAHHKMMNVPFSLLCNTRFPFNFYLWPTLKFITIPFLFKALPKGSMYFLARDTQYTVFFNLLIRIWNNFWANFVFFLYIFNCAIVLNTGHISTNWLIFCTAISLRSVLPVISKQRLLLLTRYSIGDANDYPTLRYQVI